MPQMHLYVPDSLAEEIRRRAERAGVSVSRFLAGVVQDAIREDWPEDYFDRVVGQWRGDFPDTDEPPFDAPVDLEAGPGS